MNRHLYIVLAALPFVVACRGAGPEDASRDPAANPEAPAEATTETETTIAQPPADKRPDPTDAMRQLRQQMLTIDPAELGIQVTEEFPLVYGALAEFPIGDNTATIVSLCDGTASLYTTSTFGVIGGQAHERVRTAATAFVKEAAVHHDQATASSEFPYPSAGRVRFYLLTFSGVRVIDTDMASLEAGSNPYSELFGKANNVLTELRLISQN